ncbi:unnamed protein product [Effrenium voratum]|nr:unnamed protein product [Effrenium voratum]
MSWSEELRDAAGAQWSRITQHRFTRELAAGTLDLQVMRRYLIQDHRFLDALVVLLASMVASLRSLEDRIPACQFLGSLTGPENTYFERCFQALSCTPEVRSEVPDAECTQNFDKLMREVAKGSLGEMLAVLTVCEWSYLCWAQNVAADAARENFVFYEWIDLHAGDAFAEVVQYLRQLLDREGELMEPAGREVCRRRFLQAVQLEEDFFDALYTAT